MVGHQQVARRVCGRRQVLARVLIGQRRVPVGHRLSKIEDIAFVWTVGNLMQGRLQNGGWILCCLLCRLGLPLRPLGGPFPGFNAFRHHTEPRKDSKKNDPSIFTIELSLVIFLILRRQSVSPGHWTAGDSRPSSANSSLH